MASGAPRLLNAERRIVVKVGSSLVVDRGAVRQSWLVSLAADLADLRAQGRDIIVVSSGAIALGRARLAIDRSPRLDLKQAAAAAGQPLLMHAWSECFATHGLTTAQLLLTIGDTESRGRWLNARATIETLVARGAVPIINENDSVATDEIRYGDNDRLSARVAQLAGADMLILLSDVAGLYTADPHRFPDAHHVASVERIDDRIIALAGAPLSGGLGTGGMRTKLEAARIASQSGCTTVIASGTSEHPLRALAAGALATVFAPQGSPASAYKQWIAGSLTVAGSVVLDAGAVAALRQGRSLLPSGVRTVEGDFSHGACVAITDEHGSAVGRGIIRYGAHEARLICGGRSDDIAARLGYTRGDELIHRNDMVMQ